MPLGYAPTPIIIKSIPSFSQISIKFKTNFISFLSDTKPSVIKIRNILKYCAF